MINRIKLIRLTLLGYKKNYEVKFKEGLNFISGPTSTGKSSILEMINYALGSDGHKNYIEIKKSCTDVELELCIGSKQIKISRPLFDFSRPVKVFEWDSENGEYYKRFKLLDVDVPSNENSLSKFLLDEIGDDV
jgi:DNA repair exonuclease SbcCD ATPase subunit